MKIATKDRGTGNLNDQVKILPIIFSVAAFLIYAVAAMTVAHDQKDDFIPERSSIAAAISNVAYNAPLGKVYKGVLTRLLEFSVPLNSILAQAERHEVEPGPLLGSTSDGNGIGYITVASLAMRLFGARTSSLIISMIAIMGLSAVTLYWRFRDRYAVVIILYFTALTGMLFTSLTWQRDYLLNIGVGGIRYFSLVAILPAYHLLLELVDTQKLDSITKRVGITTLAIQVIILLLAILVRNSAASLILAIAIGGLIVLWKNRRHATLVARMLRNTAYMTVVGTTFVAILMILVSSTYMANGRFTETVWHRIFLGFGVNPEWPFKGVQTLFDCKRYIPEGLVPNSEDRNAHCVWWDYATTHNIPVDRAVEMTYGREYDVALREAFFKIARLYPVETLKTFAYYKTAFIFRSIAKSLHFGVPGIHPVLIWLLLAAIANVLIFAFTASQESMLSSISTFALITVIFGGFSLLPYYAVWALPHTTGDLLFFCFSGFGLACVTAIEKIRVTMSSR